VKVIAGRLVRRRHTRILAKIPRYHVRVHQQVFPIISYRFMTPSHRCCLWLIEKTHTQASTHRCNAFDGLMAFPSRFFREYPRQSHGDVFWISGERPIMGYALRQGGSASPRRPRRWYPNGPSLTAGRTVCSAVENPPPLIAWARASAAVACVGDLL
jgi:hypothetical protein